MRDEWQSEGITSQEENKISKRGKNMVNTSHTHTHTHCEQVTGIRSGGIEGGDKCNATTIY